MAGYVRQVDSLGGLAISMQAQRGVYALLLGSGVSSGAGIPTGHEVMVDLIRKLAETQDAAPEPDPERWFATTFGEDPAYTSILEQIGQTPTMRQNILRGYFEPTRDEAERGVKVPGRAHKAIARLAADGFVKVVLTVNFDRLLETALEEAGVRPTIISTIDSAKGAAPLVHNDFTLIKLNGDYRDTRIRNTTEELRAYEAPIRRSLDRVLDEYGLIVVGWSARWDAALRQAIERATNRRYPMYWAHRSQLGPDETRLIEHRRADTIEIESADGFFESLQRAVDALQRRGAPARLGAGEISTPEVAAATLKRDLLDPTQRIVVADLVRSQALALRNAIDVANFPVEGGSALTLDEAFRRTATYMELASSCTALIAVGAAWATSDQIRIFTELLESIAEAGSSALSGITAWINLRKFPALVLLYAGGISAVAEQRYDSLSALLNAKVPDGRGSMTDAARGLDPGGIVDFDLSRAIVPEKQTSFFSPTSEYLYRELRGPLRDSIPTEAAYTRAFNRFEYILALVQLARGDYPHMGRFAWIMRRGEGWGDPSREVSDELEVQGDSWLPIASGLLPNATEARALIDSLSVRVKRLGFF
jgi:hypothetical protein